MPTVRQTSDPPAGEASAAEWRWVALVSLAVIVATCIPYLFGWFITPPGSQYMGLLANPDEHNVYLGWMRQAERGRLLFLDPFTTEPQQAGFFHGFFLTLGIAARLTHVPLIGVYHIARVICGMLLLLGIYALAVQILDGLLARRLAWGLAALSSGFGWLYAAIRPGAAVHPVDFGPGLVMPEAITFLSLLLNPLFCFSVFLMVVLWTAYLAAVRANSWKLAALAGAAGFLLGNVHTYNVITVWLTLVLYIAALAIVGRRLPAREALFAGLVAVMSMPFVIYQYSLFQANAVFREKALTLTLTPPAAFFIAGYGLVFLLAIPGAIVALGRRDKPQVLLVAWAAATLLLVFFAPVSFQRKMAEGLHVPVCLLAALFVGGWLAAKLRHRMAATLAVALVILGMPSNALFVARGFHDLTTNNAAYVHVLMPPLYLRSDTVEAMRWLRDHATMDEAVLCAPLAGSYVPGAAGTTVFIGHWAETLHYPDKLGDVLWFFSGRPQPGERRAFMESNGLRYVLYTPDEAALGPFNPGASPDFDLVLARPQAQLFRLAPAD